MRILLWLFPFVFCFACGGGSSSDVQPTQNNDSLAQKLNSPELKKINERILADPGNAALYHERAAIYAGLHELGATVNDEKRAIALDSTRADYHIALVDAYFSQNNTRAAKELLERTAVKFPDNTEALLKLAELFWLVRDYQKGIDYVNKALRIDEHLAKGYYIKGGIYRESGDTSRAISSLETAAEQDNRFADAFYDIGVIYAARKNPIALQYYDNALAIDPHHEDAQYAKAKLLQDLGRMDEAIAGYEAIIKNNPGCGRCHYNLGAIQLHVKHNNKAALEHFTSAINLNPDNVDAYFARGFTYSQLKDKESARADYKMCLELSPDYEPALQGLSQLSK